MQTDKPHTLTGEIFGEAFCLSCDTMTYYTQLAPSDPFVCVECGEEVTIDEVDVRDDPFYSDELDYFDSTENL